MFWNHGYELRATIPTSSCRYELGYSSCRHAITRVASADGVDEDWYEACVQGLAAHVEADTSGGRCADDVDGTPSVRAATTASPSSDEIVRMALRWETK
jgi:hypothetical protein